MLMIRLTKRARNTIYKEALKSHIQHKLGLCSAISDGICTVYPNEHPTIGYNKGIMNRFPEINKYKPKGKHNYWFTNTEIGFSTRLSILEEAIILTNEQHGTDN